MAEPKEEMVRMILHYHGFEERFDPILQAKFADILKPGKIHSTRLHLSDPNLEEVRMAGPIRDTGKDFDNKELAGKNVDRLLLLAEKRAKAVLELDDNYNMSLWMEDGWFILDHSSRYLVVGVLAERVGEDMYVFQQAVQILPYAMKDGLGREQIWEAPERLIKDLIRGWARDVLQGGGASNFNPAGLAQAPYTT